MPQADPYRLAPSTNEQSPSLSNQPQCFYKEESTPTHREGRLGLAAPQPRAGRGLRTPHHALDGHLAPGHDLLQAGVQLQPKLLQRRPFFRTQEDLVLQIDRGRGLMKAELNRRAFQMTLWYFRAQFKKARTAVHQGRPGPHAAPSGRPSRPGRPRRGGTLRRAQRPPQTLRAGT